jgi:hypothetical protein
VLIALTNRAIDKTSFGITMDYVNRVPLEFQAFYIHLVSTKHPRVKETSAYIDWMSEHANLVK